MVYLGRLEALDYPYRETAWAPAGACAIFWEMNMGEAPIVWHRYGKHEMLVDTTHDEGARVDFAINLQRYLGTKVFPGHRDLYEKAVEPKFVKQNGRKPKDRHEVRKAMLKEPYFQYWSHLRLFAQENTYWERSRIVDRQLDSLVAKAKPRKGDKGRVEIDPRFEVPPYQAPFDMHWMPGSFFTEFVKDDVSGGAMYDLGGLYVTTHGKNGRYNDGAAWSVVRFVKEHFPDFKPARVLDEGCTVGHNTLPYKEAWPQAEVIGIDIGAPVLRYAHRRAESIGVPVTFSQQNAERTKYADDSFDFVVSTMLLHETSYKAVYNIVRDNYRVLKKGGLMIHVEQPPFSWAPSAFDQLMKDWDTHNNNEPFWGTMHDMDLEDVAQKAGFRREDVIMKMAPVVTPTDADKLRVGSGQWFIFAAWKR
ncbi:MAG: class I SAM-dependent methyltransferase [Alphaproteobacteria bacterium]|nr:class I SAM-dependent methyltransferase [Alphaproteobacteria bacterium]